MSKVNFFFTRKFDKYFDSKLSHISIHIILIKNLLLSICFLIMVGCDHNVVPDNPEINPNIVLIKSCCGGITDGNYLINVWFEDKIYSSTGYLRHITMDAQFHIVSDTINNNTFNSMLFRYLTINKTGDKILLVNSKFIDVSSGALYELNLVTNQLTVVKNDYFNISSAIYLNNFENECIYYSYGNEVYNLIAGYYHLNLSNGDDSLVLPFSSDLGAMQYKEFVNGFDLSPDDKKLLLPVHRQNLPAEIAYYDIENKELDTIDIPLNQQFVWLRYNKTGNKILYCSYPKGVGGSNVNEPSEIGIIDIPTMSLKKLDVNTDSNLSMSMFPNWSTDNNNIVFGSAKGPAVEPPGSVGSYSIYVLKNIN